MKMLVVGRARQRAQRSVTTLLERSGCNSVIGVWPCAVEGMGLVLGGSDGTFL